jgi:phage head maturation protease
MDSVVGFSADKAKLGLRQADGKPVVIAGYGIVYNELSTPRFVKSGPNDAGKFVRYRFLSGSAIPTPSVKCQVMHERGRLLGRTDNQTMRLTPDDYGVFFECDLPDTTDGKDTATLVARDDFQGSSVGALGMITKSAGKDDKGIDILEVSRFFYGEISIVDDPSFLNAGAEIVGEQADTAVAPVDAAPVDQTAAEPMLEVIAAKKRMHEANKRKLQIAQLRGQSIQIEVQNKKTG